MKKNKEILEKRHQYIKNSIAKSKSTQVAVKKLAKKLFLSETTIYYDLSK